MELKITREWFEKRAALEADLEVGDRGCDPVACAPLGETDSLLRAVIVGTAVGPAVGGLQVVLFIWFLASGGEPSMGKLWGLSVVTFVAMLQAYKIAALPAAVASLLMYQTVRLRMSSAAECIVAATVGAAAAWVALVGFTGVVAGMFYGLVLLGVLPALAARHVYRRTAHLGWGAMRRRMSRGTHGRS